VTETVLVRSSWYLRSAPQLGQKVVLLAICRPHSGHFVDQLVGDGVRLSLLLRLLAILVSPTANTAAKANPRRTVVSSTSFISKFGDSGNMKSVKATVETIPAAPIPTRGCFIFSPAYRISLVS